MAKPESRTCIVKGCEKWKVKGDYCTAHSKEFAPSGEVIDPFEGIDAGKKAVAGPDPVAIPVPSDHEVHVVNLVELFRARQQAELDEFVASLGMLVDPIARLQFAYQRVCA